MPGVGRGHAGASAYTSCVAESRAPANYRAGDLACRGGHVASSDLGSSDASALYIGSPCHDTLGSRRFRRRGADTSPTIGDAARPLQGPFGGQVSLLLVCVPSLVGAAAALQDQRAPTRGRKNAAPCEALLPQEAALSGSGLGENVDRSRVARGRPPSLLCARLFLSAAFPLVHPLVFGKEINLLHVALSVAPLLLLPVLLMTFRLLRQRGLSDTLAKRDVADNHIVGWVQQFASRSSLIQDPKQ